MMKLKIVMESCYDRGDSVTVPSLLGCISEGNTRKEILKNIKEAILLYLEPAPSE